MNHAAIDKIAIKRMPKRAFFVCCIFGHYVFLLYLYIYFAFQVLSEYIKSFYTYFQFFFIQSLYAFLPYIEDCWQNFVIYFPAFVSDKYFVYFSLIYIRLFCYEL